MITSHRLGRGVVALGAIYLAALCSHRSDAQQPKVPLIIVPPPQAPTLAPPLPLGVQRGTKLDLNLTGTNLADVTGLLTSFPAKIAIPTENTNGKDPTKVLVKLEVAADVPLGFHTIRIATKQGLSNARIFCVDDLPQVAEVDTNRAKMTAQPVPVPCVVTGRTDAEVSDFYKITVKANQRVSFEVIGRRLGSALDPILMLHSVKTGREVAGLYSDDAPGLQSDARFTHTFAEAGEYLVEIRDTTYKGGADYFYRLRIGDFPCAITAFPMAIKRGAKANIGFAGPLVEGVAPVEITAPVDPMIVSMNVVPKFSSVAESSVGWPLPVRISDHDEIAEIEPNNEQAKATRIPVPSGVTGRFLEKSDVDEYVFAAKKGVKYTINAETYEIGSPAEVYVIVKDGKNAELAKTNPAAAPKLEWTATADGDFFLHVEHLNFANGPNEVYHLTITEPTPDFEVIVGLDRFEVAPGSTGIVPITNIVRRDYAGPIEVSVVGPAGVTGTITVTAVAPQPNLPIALLPITVAPGTAVGAHSLQIRAKAMINGKEVVRIGRVSDIVKTYLANLPFPPESLSTQIGLAITDAPLFSLSIKYASPDIVKGIPANMTVTAVRSAGFAEDIILAPIAMPPGVAPAMKNIAKGTNEVVIVLTPAPTAPIGVFPISVRGQGKSQNRDFAYYAAPTPLSIALPFDLQVQGAPVSLKVGMKAKFKVKAIRKGGYAGPIVVEVRNLPANVTATKPTIDMGKDEVEIELTAAATAVPGDKVDVNAFGTAPAAANQTAASANFVLKVEK